MAGLSETVDAAQHRRPRQPFLFEKLHQVFVEMLPLVHGGLAMKKYLQLDDPATVCMIGDNYITDGGAIDAGMRFIHVQPVPGPENPLHRATRFIAYRFARLYSRFR